MIIIRYDDIGLSLVWFLRRIIGCLVMLVSNKPTLNWFILTLSIK